MEDCMDDYVFCFQESVSLKAVRHAVKTTKGYYVDPNFSEVWRVLNVNSAKDSGGIFDAIVQAKFSCMSLIW